jgi:hypothetical protein
MSSSFFAMSPGTTSIVSCLRPRPPRSTKSTIPLGHLQHYIGLPQRTTRASSKAVCQAQVSSCTWYVYRACDLALPRSTFAFLRRVPEMSRTSRRRSHPGTTPKPVPIRVCTPAHDVTTQLPLPLCMNAKSYGSTS